MTPQNFTPDLELTSMQSTEYINKHEPKNLICKFSMVVK
jgi:hypothetical protein